MQMGAGDDPGEQPGGSFGEKPGDGFSPRPGDGGATGARAPKKRRLGIAGYFRAMVIARTAAVSWPEAKEMARRSDEPLSGQTDIPTESERRRDAP